MAAVVREILGPKLAHFGWEPVAARTTGRSPCAGCSSRASGRSAPRRRSAPSPRARFDSGVVDGDLATAVLATVGSVNRPGDFDETLTRFRAAKDPQSENRYRRSLAQFHDEALTRRCFEMCFSEFRSKTCPCR